MGIVKGLVNPNVINAFTAIHLEYARMLDESPAQWSDLIVEEMPPTPTLSDDFFIDLSTGGFRPWTGERQLRDVTQDKFTTSKEHFEDSMAIPRLLAENGTYQALARSEAQRFAANQMSFVNKLAKRMLQLGKTKRCWDGSYFFAKDHKIDTRGGAGKSGVFPNLILSGDNLDLDATNWAAFKADAESVLAPDGQPYGAQVTGLIFTPRAEAKVKKLFDRETVNGGDTNEYAGDLTKEQRRKAIDLADEPSVIYPVLSVPGRARPLPMAQTVLNTSTMGEESEFCALFGKVAELADFYASMGYANPRLVWRWELP